MDSDTQQVCILCGITKNLEDFYQHKQMKLGVDSKCKECVKCRASKRYQILSLNADFIENERLRHRLKYKTCNYRSKQKEWDENKPWKKTTIYKSLNKKLNLPSGLEVHHWNYNDDFLEDVFILSRIEHKRLHQYLNLDLEKRLFYLSDGTLLDTREKHLAFINNLDKNKNYEKRFKPAESLV